MPKVEEQACSVAFWYPHLGLVKMCFGSADNRILYAVRHENMCDRAVLEHLRWFCPVMQMSIFAFEI